MGITIVKEEDREIRSRREGSGGEGEDGVAIYIRQSGEAFLIR